MSDYKDPDEFFDARIAPALAALEPMIEQIVHDQLLAVLRDEGYREVVRRVWAEKIGDKRGMFPASDVVTAMSWRVQAVADAQPPTINKAAQ